MTFYVPIGLPSVANLREHWSVKQRRTRRQREVVAWILGAKPRPPLPAVVTLTRVAPRALDDDNLRTACKAARDQIADWLGLPNDRDPRVEWRYGQRRGGVREQALVVEFAAVGAK